MDFKRITTTLCLFSMILLFTQCEKEEMILKKGDQSAAEAAQNNPHAKKPDKPPEPDTPPSEAAYVIITGDVVGEGLASTSVKEYLPFTLTLGDPFPAGTHEGEIRILYGTKKKSENRIDFKYIDSNSGDPKALIIRAETNTGAYDPEARILTLNNCFAIIAERDGTGENYTDYTPASATVVFSD